MYNFVHLEKIAPNGAIICYKKFKVVFSYTLLPPSHATNRNTNRRSLCCLNVASVPCKMGGRRGKFLLRAPAAAAAHQDEWAVSQVGAGRSCLPPLVPVAKSHCGCRTYFVGRIQRQEESHRGGTRPQRGSVDNDYNDGYGSGYGNSGTARQGVGR
jgi:hypothetical protein